jgi:hypothetical protein
MKRCVLALLLAPFLAASTVGGGAVVEWGTDVIEMDIPVLDFPCWGEEQISVYNYFPYTWHRVQTPKGEWIKTIKWDTENVVGIVVGLETGRVWVRDHNVVSQVDRSTGGGMTRINFSGLWLPLYEGPVIRIHETVHMSYDANGKLRVDRYELRCKDKE